MRRIALSSHCRRSATICATLPALFLCASQPSPAQGHSSTFDVTFRPETDAQHKVVAVVVKERIASGSAGRPLAITVPLKYVGLIPFATQISDVTARDEKGVLAMATEETTLPDGMKVRRWRSARAVSGTANLQYTLALQPPGMTGPPYGAKAGGLGVSGNTDTMVVIPEGLPEGRNSLRWDLSRMAPGSRGVFTGGEDTITVSGAPDQLLDRWLMAGRLQGGQPRATEGFNAYTLGTPPFPAIKAMTWGRVVYTALAQAYGYLGVPRYELLIRTLDAPSFATGTATYRGGGSLVTTGSPTYLRGQTDGDVFNTIAHEIGHQWVGQFDGGGSLWFAEGLNVYVTSTVPCEAGLQSWSECGDQVTKWSKAYYDSEGRDWSQARIEDAPFGREDLRLVSYGRGMMYFANLDAAIRTQSQGKRTLLTALRPLFEARRDGHPITMQSWETWLRGELGEGGVASFRNTVLGGSVIKPDSAAFGGHLKPVPTSYQHGTSSRSGYIWRSRSPG